MGTEGGAVRSEQRVPLPTFDAFYDSALPQVYGYVLRLCGGDEHAAWDLTQDAWTTLVDHLVDGRTDVMSVGWLIAVSIAIWRPSSDESWKACIRSRT